MNTVFLSGKTVRGAGSVVPIAVKTAGGRASRRIPPPPDSDRADMKRPIPFSFLSLLIWSGGVCRAVRSPSWRLSRLYRIGISCRWAVRLSEHVLVRKALAIHGDISNAARSLTGIKILSDVIVPPYRMFVLHYITNNLKL